MGFGQFLLAPEYDLTIITHRDIFQNTALEASRTGEEYAALSAILMLDGSDLKKMGIKENSNVILKNSYGRIIVKAVLSGYEEPHPGIGYMLNGPWSNMLVSVERGGNGVPGFKLIEAKISDAKGEMITSFEVQ